MIKYASNALLANLISFSNEIANLGIRARRHRYYRGHARRAPVAVFPRPQREGMPPIVRFLQAGCGFGGSCLPKDASPKH